MYDMRIAALLRRVSLASLADSDLWSGFMQINLQQLDRTTATRLILFLKLLRAK